MQQPNTYHVAAVGLKPLCSGGGVQARVRGVVAHGTIDRASHQHQGSVFFAPPYTRLKRFLVGGGARGEAQVVALALEVAPQLAPGVGDYRGERGFTPVLHGLDQQHCTGGDLKSKGKHE